jgi:hypothetical protein
MLMGWIRTGVYQYHTRPSYHSLSDVASPVPMRVNRNQPYFPPNPPPFLPQPGPPNPPYPAPGMMGNDPVQGQQFWPFITNGYPVSNLRAPAPPPPLNHGYPNYGPLAPYPPQPSFPDQGSMPERNATPPAAYIHSSWAAVIPPNGVPGHPSLTYAVINSNGMEMAKVQSAPIVLRRPDGQPISLQNGGDGVSLHKDGNGNVALSGKGTAGEYKASLSPSGLSKFVSVRRCPRVAFLTFIAGHRL